MFALFEVTFKFHFRKYMAVLIQRILWFFTLTSSGDQKYESERWCCGMTKTSYSLEGARSEEYAAQGRISQLKLEITYLVAFAIRGCAIKSSISFHCPYYSFLFQLYHLISVTFWINSFTRFEHLIINNVLQISPYAQHFSVVNVWFCSTC